MTKIINCHVPGDCTLQGYAGPVGGGRGSKRNFCKRVKLKAARFCTPSPSILSTSPGSPAAKELEYGVSHPLKRLLENLRQSVINAAKVLPRAGKVLALGALIAASTLTLASCPSPAGPGVPPTGPPNEDPNPTKPAPVDASSYKIDIKDNSDNLLISIKLSDKNSDGRTITSLQTLPEIGWQQTYQKDPPLSTIFSFLENVKVDVYEGEETTVSDVDLGTLAGEIKDDQSITITFTANAPVSLSERDMNAIAAYIKSKLPSAIASLVDITRGDNITSGEYSIDYPIEITIPALNGAPEQLIELKKPNEDLEADMQWFKEYQTQVGNLVLSLPAAAKSVYDLGTLGLSANIILDLKLNTTETGYGKEISFDEVNLLEIKFSQKLDNRPVDVDIGNLDGVTDYTNVTSFNDYLGNLPASGTIVNNTATLTISLGSYTPANAAFDAPSDLTGKDIEVAINRAGASTDDISLTYIHYLRQALQAKAGAGKTVTIALGDADALTPSFNSNEWVQNGTSPFDALNAGTVLIDGIEIKSELDTNTGTYRKYIEYDTDLMIDGNLRYRAHFPNIYGFGIKRKPGSSTPKLSAKDGWDNVTLDSPGGETSGYWEYFFQRLREAGLSSIVDPDGAARDNDDPDRPFPKWNVNVALPAEEVNPIARNVMSNYMYDELLAYFNKSFQSRIINIVSVGAFTCDGSAAVPDNVPPRKIGGVTLGESMSRRDGFVEGLVSDTYRGTLTPGLVTFLKNKVGITTYSNVNVIGNESEWNGEGRSQFTFKNAGIKGTYSTLLQSKFAGIIDIDINKSIENISSADAKLVLYQNSSNSMGFEGFEVVDASKLTGNFNNVGQITLNNPYTPPVVIIYPSRSAAQNFGAAPGPDYRAYVNTGADNAAYPYKFANLSTSTSAPPNWDTSGGKIASLSTIKAVPSLDDNDWEQLGNGNITNVPIKAWGSVTEKFSSMSGDGVALAPASSGIRLAGMMPAWAQTATLPSVLFGRDDKKRQVRPVTQG